MQRIRIVLVSLLIVVGFGALSTSCGGGGCGSHDQPKTPTSPP